MRANFAHLYEQLNDETFYQQWYQFLQPYLQEKKTILDLGCGNGTLLKLLHDDGHQIVGVDISEDMLTLAAERLGNNQFLYEADMSEFCLGNAQYDIIISTCDSLNYLSSKEKIEQVFGNVRTMLKEDGFFIFDMHSDFTFMERFKNWSYGDASVELSVIWNIDVVDDFLYEHFLTFYILDEVTKMYSRLDILQQEYFYNTKTILELLATQQFLAVQYMSDFTNQYNEKGERTFFICK